MSTASLVLAGSSSILVAVIIAAMRMRRIHGSYHPFVVLLFAGLINEVVSYLLIHVFKESNAVTTNILGLIEGLLWIEQFRRWNTYHDARWAHRVLVAVVLITWTTENVVLEKIFLFSSAYSIGYSFLLVFLAINQMNGLIVSERGNLLVNSRFLISSGVLVFYSYRIFVESFYFFELEESDEFLANVFSILAFVNLFVNLLFALAAVWIPSRQKFSLPYY